MDGLIRSLRASEQEAREVALLAKGAQRLRLVALADVLKAQANSCEREAA